MPNNTLPLVSVLMTVYNREKYIAEAIESVLKSTYQNFELIIVDDCSIDKSVEIAKAYAEKDPCIQVYVNEQNLGDYPNRNKAASYAKGTYLKYLDSDDLIYPHGLEIMVNAMEKFPEVGIACPNTIFPNKLPYKVNAENAYKEHYFRGSLMHFGPSACIYKKDYFDSLGGFKVSYGVGSDQANNLGLSAVNGIILFQRDLIWWRRHDEQEFILKKHEYAVVNRAYNLNILRGENCPLSAVDCKLAIQNQYVHDARIVYNCFLNFKIKQAFRLLKKLDINIRAMLLALLPKHLRNLFL